MLFVSDKHPFLQAGTQGSSASVSDAEVDQHSSRQTGRYGSSSHVSHVAQYSIQQVGCLHL